ncbi:hypothetical protein EG66_02000 [Helicobacter pylori]|uniref:hypothetical protein n=1 Tax=Helicobacter pylori TaxID=210 RepID=UPI000458810B|nr:hypothetical protein [Helicobacter pylori]AHZ27959.1 hypothetical protein EG66_02000 [Helicobacter pylori]
MYQNNLREQLLFYQRALDKGKFQSYLAKVLSFNSDTYTLSAELILHQQEPIIVKNLSVFSSPLISTQLRPNDYGVLVSLGFDIGNFFNTKQIGNNDCDSFIFLPLNMKPTTQGTYIQAPTNENNNLNIGNDSVTINSQDNHITINNQEIQIKTNQSQLQLNNTSAELSASQVKISANTPINLNGANLTQSFSAILQALNQINITLQTIKYMPGSMSVPPITIDSQAITNSNGKIE